MTLIIHLPDEQEAALKERAQSQGLSAEEYAQQVLVHELEASSSEPFWKAFTRRMHSLPDEVFEHLPTDGASEHDHYLYGSPRRNQQ
jgi:plasmid stability protein